MPENPPLSQDVALATTAFVLVFGLAFAALTATASSSVVIAPDSDVTVLTLELKQGEKVDCSYSSVAPIKFEIRLYGTIEELSVTGLSGQNRFVAPSDGFYYFRFANSNPDISVIVSYDIKKVDDSAGLLALVALGAVAFLALLAVVAYVLSRERKRMGKPPV